HVHHDHHMHRVRLRCLVVESAKTNQLLWLLVVEKSEVAGLQAGDWMAKLIGDNNVDLDASACRSPTSPVRRGAQIAWISWEAGLAARLRLRSRYRVLRVCRAITRRDCRQSHDCRKN